MSIDTQAHEADSEPNQTPSVPPAGASINAVLSEKTERGARLRQSWRESAEGRKVFIAGWVLAATVVILTLAAAGVGYASAPSDEELGFYAPFSAAVTFFITAYLGGFAFVLYRGQKRRAWYDRVVVTKAYEVASDAEVKAGESELDLPTLWAFTQKRLDYYHRLATSQSEKSFNYGLAAAGVGFLVIVGSAIAAALGRSDAASISAGLVGVAGGGLAAYIGGTFMRLQENAAAQLRAYFSQPLEVSRFLQAERLLAQVDVASRPAAAREIIQALADSRKQVQSMLSESN